MTFQDGSIDWLLGVTYSVLASIIGGASKLSIRKSWLIAAHPMTHSDTCQNNHGGDAVTESNGMSPLEVAVSNPAFPRADSPTGTSLRQKHTLTSWVLYMTGMIGMTFLNPLCCVLAMNYANPSILAPFSGLTLVWVVMFSEMCVGERPNSGQRMACGLIVLGQVLVAVFGDHTNGSDAGVEDVISSYRRTQFRIFLIFMTGVIVLLGVLICRTNGSPRWNKMAWGSIGGAITGFQNFLKDALTISNATKQSDAVSLPPIFFVFVMLAMTTAFVGLLCLAACMKRFDATYSAAMFVVSFVISATLMSVVHYHTFQDLEGLASYIMYPVGLLTLLVGASMLIGEEKAESVDFETDDFRACNNPVHSERLLLN